MGGRGSKTPRDESDPAVKATRLGIVPPEHARPELRSLSLSEDHSQRPTSPPKWVTGVLDAREPVSVEGRSVLRSGDLVEGTSYRLHRWLGEGGMGVVFEAEHVDLERRVAVKILRHEACADARALEQFRAEAKAASRIGSPYIVQVFDFAELGDGRLMFAMELLSGTSLHEALRRTGPFGIDRLIGVLRQVCKGLQHAHAAGIVHRDVKPENIYLVEEHNRADAVKLLDFGIATVIDDTGAAVGCSAGTPDYIAPEVVSGYAYDHRVDIYALGCTAYEMLTGQPPFVAEHVAEVLLGHVDDEPQRPSVVRGGTPLPSGLEAVIMRCLAKSPEERFQDMNDLEAALCEAQIQARVQTAWDDLPVPDVDPERRARIVGEMPDLATPEPQRNRGGVLAVAAVVALAVAGAIGYSLRSEDEQALGQPDRIQSLVDAAREAAAKNYYVYPPLENPSSPTAFTHLVALEGLEGELGEPGQDAASRLRAEFASTLVRTGDGFWDEEDGKAFAVDFYIQALMFDPTREPARSRASMSPGELALLRKKASEGAFDEADLVAVEALGVLTEADEGERRRRLEGLRARSKSRAAKPKSRDEAMNALLTKRGMDPVDVAAVPQPEVATGTATTGAEEDPGSGAEDLEGTLSASTRDPSKAKKFAKQGATALREGRTAEAGRLFERALGFDHRNGTALIGMSDVYFDRGNYPMAVRYAEKAVAALPRRAGFRLKLGDAYFKVLRYQEAKRAYEKASDLGSDDARWRLDRVNTKLGG